MFPEAATQQVSWGLASFHLSSKEGNNPHVEVIALIAFFPDPLNRKCPAVQ